MAKNTTGAPLAEYERVMKLLGAAFLDAYALLTPDGKITSFNRSFFLFFPRKVARKLEGSSLTSCMKLSLGGGPLDVVAECTGRGAAVRFDEVSAEVPDREPMTFIVSAVPLVDADGTGIAIMAVFRDVTDQAQIQGKYKEVLEKETAAREELQKELEARTAEVLKANDQLNALQQELIEYQKGLRLA